MKISRVGPELLAARAVLLATLCGVASQLRAAVPFRISDDDSDKLANIAGSGAGKSKSVMCDQLKMISVS
jgi:hypothetical protein